MTAGHCLPDALDAATGSLAAAGVPSPRADAELLAGHVLGLSRGQVRAGALTATSITAGRLAAFEELVEQRRRRVPLQHLTGRAPFRRLELRVGPGVFVPRPETEVTAGLAIEQARLVVAQSGRVLVVDLCTGSAAIALAVATEVPQARVVALELDPLAYGWAEANVDDLGPMGRIEVRLGDAAGADTGTLADLAGQVDVLVANPPYIPPHARPVDPEVAEHDPEAALYGGGPDGLAVPSAVVSAARGLLRPGGVLVMEHGETQGPGTLALVRGAGWVQGRTVADLAGRPRVLMAHRGTDPDVPDGRDGSAGATVPD